MAQQTGTRGKVFVMVERPTVVNCEVCGVEVPVGPRGRVPRFCAEHRGGRGPADVSAVSSVDADAAEPGGDEPTVAEAGTVEDPEPEPAVSGPGSAAALPLTRKLRRVAPRVWMDDKGRRHLG